MDTPIKNWLVRAKQLLEASLNPVPNELNEIDWKFALSPNKHRLTEHLSAFANYPGGGFLAYGIEPQKGEIVGCSETQIEESIKQLTNLGREALEPPVALDHFVCEIANCAVLFIYIPESDGKPVHLRGKPVTEAFIRSGGTSRKASKQEVGGLMLNSRIDRWEDLRASKLMSGEEMLKSLDIATVLKMAKRPIPTEPEELLARMHEEHFISLETTGGGYITNLGAIAAANSLKDFTDLARKAVRVIIYNGKNRSTPKLEQPGNRGYAIRFQRMIDFIRSQLPQREETEKGLRVRKEVYPEDTIREIVANALIHQDFTVGGAGPVIEIFDDRIEVTNPGRLLPSKNVYRLIGTTPESRNERLASSFRLYNICEERGSGLEKAALAAEFHGLPALGLEAGANHFKVTIYGPRTFAQMTVKERMDACYQHAVLKHLSNEVLTNTSLRERLKMPKEHVSMVSALIQEAVDKGLIKSADPHSTSKRFAEYIPAWA